MRRAVSGSGIGSSAAGKPPQGNAWLLSKALPVDVRLLAAGAASIGALYYYSSRSAVARPRHYHVTPCTQRPSTADDGLRATYDGCHTIPEVHCLHCRS